MPDKTPIVVLYREIGPNEYRFVAENTSSLALREVGTFTHARTFAGREEAEAWVARLTPPLARQVAERRYAVGRLKLTPLGSLAPHSVTPA